ncbi:MAG: hypothetical protein H6719_24155 [Sandaracinaceae bacterium]|nr:hypothetical protein [Myxococcales bacterium]MCB9595836.1 hypothetical protein [Sandaracinaceae bacterium]
MSLLHAIEEAADLDVLARPLEPGELARRLDASVDAATRSSARSAFDTGPSRMPELVALGRRGLWIATVALLDALPTQRAMPWPPYERWDALVELHASRAEAAWLVADVFASLGPSQAALARRTLYGLERRFGARGLACLGARAGASPHAALLAE